MSCAPYHPLGRLVWPELTSGLTPDSQQQNILKGRVNMGRHRFRAALWGRKNVFARPGPNAVLSLLRRYRCAIVWMSQSTNEQGRPCQRYSRWIDWSFRS
jgi:hypothetical protein